MMGLPFFDDLASYGHAVMGFVAAQTPEYRALITLGFVLYQMFEPEPLPNKIGDFGEFATGYLLSEVRR